MAGALTILDSLDQRARERGDHPALLEPRSSSYDAWDTVTWSEYARTVKQLARGFIALGHRPKDAVCIIGPNRPAWVLADIAAIAAGGVPAGIYATATAEQTEYILAHAGASIVVVSDSTQAEKVRGLLPKLPMLKAIVLFPGVSKPANAERVYGWDEVLEKSAETPEARLDELKSGFQPSDTATLIYTSGTTGPPKAVMLSHGNLLWTAGQVSQIVDVRAGDRSLSYLPLSHVAEQMLSIHGPLSVGVSVHFVPVMDQLPAALVAVRPQFLFAVPRVWEKMQAKIEAGVREAPSRRQRIFRLAQRVGRKVMLPRFTGQEAPVQWRIAYPLLDRLVYSKLRARLGLDQARVLATGAAPLSAATHEWFLSLGVAIGEVYGQSEDTGPTTYNSPGSGKLGTVGRPIRGVEVKIAEDGEILVKGPNVFQGYYKDPTATAEVLENGWLKSGDVGVVDGQGFLKITDRKKDLIITAGGKNIAPQNIERMLVDLELVSQAVVIGDRRKYLTALITLVPEALDRFCRDNDISEADPARRVAHPRVRAEIERQIKDRVNPKLAQYETVKRFEILPAELTEVAGELTPTLKIKRKVVSARYEGIIERMYEGAEAVAA